MTAKASVKVRVIAADAPALPGLPSKSGTADPMTTRPEPLVSSHESWGRMSATKFPPSQAALPGRRGSMACGWHMMTGTPPGHDTYDSFLARLDAATTTLSTRAASLEKALAAATLLLDPYESAVRNWERRRLHVSRQLARHTASPQSYTTLGELHDVAVNMEAMFRDRAQRIRDKLSAMQGRREAIDTSLMELELSRVKLTSSRLLSEDREKLSAVFAAFAGPAVATSALPDRGLLGDLREARKAIVLAEALMEVKGY